MIQENFCCQWLHTDPILDVTAQMPVEGPLSVLSTTGRDTENQPQLMLRGQGEMNDSFYAHHIKILNRKLQSRHTTAKKLH